MPCWELFLKQSSEYQLEVLGDSPRISVEAAATLGWRAIVGDEGLTIGIDHFGASAPAEVLAEKFRLTGEAIAEQVRAHLRK